MSSRRLFHKYGPACAKALCPHVIVDFGMIRARDVDERKFQAGIVDTEKRALMPLPLCIALSSEKLYLGILGYEELPN